ncbi:MAG: exodeoxyribonuclease V subunit gamma [Azoarcus sp.]|jgi:exodeoxyribonuclease V gamma subunit|nr:exodeoxyribonuclease V subunit gamma [Azoarcus sp.]
MFSVTFSNRCENLLDVLLARLEAERDGPFVRAQIIVPGSALRRHIELSAAARDGICAGIDFNTLAQWLWRQIAHFVDVPEVSPYTPPALIWRIFAGLDSPWVEKHERLARYLHGADARKRFELAGRLARLFDHYLCYRPAWLERWAEGETAFSAPEENLRADEAWQAELWRHIHGGDKAIQLPFMDFLRRAGRMDNAALMAAGLPASVSIFGLPTLPPLYLEVLRVLARAMDVHLYILNPCREYWFDIIDARSLSWLARRQRDLFLETGNKLLAAWGKQKQTHIESLYEGEHPMLERAAFAPHPGHHLLARLQNAILDLREPGAGSIRLEDNDRSIELHLCHSRIRELEVLRDRLLGLFKGPKPPKPEEIVVLTPDLAACAPLIEAVFGAAPRERYIPWRITGLGPSEENPVARALDWLLALAAGRAPASRVFDLLQQPLVAARFGLDEAGLEQVRVWMDDAGMRWGLDEEQARATGSSGGHTMETGLARLFLSWTAGEAANRALFAGHTGIARAPRGSAGLALGAFWRYIRVLTRLRTKLLQTRDAEGWRAILLDALAALTGDVPELAEESRSAREAINALADDIAAGFGKEEGKETGIALPLDVIHPALADRLDEGARGGVPGGAVTFGALPSLRALPYRVVCIIGLDYNAFPGREHADEFDLMAARPRKGDRQRRDDERNLFLDAVLAARDVLHLSCIGRSAQNNSESPPSVLVDELLDTLAVACAENPEQAASLAAARARLTVAHPLQSFSSAYFVENKDKRLENFCGEFAEALNIRSRNRAAPLREIPDRFDEDDDDDENESESGNENEELPDVASESLFFTKSLPSPSEDWRRVDIDRLKRFFNNPCRFLLRERLGLDLPFDEEEPDDVEPLVPGWHSRKALASRLLPVLLAGGDKNASTNKNGEPDEARADDFLALARAGGEYPVGALGESALGRELGALRAFADRVNAARAGAKQPARTLRLDFDLDSESWTLQAGFSDLRADGLVYQRYDDTRASDYLAAWLDHLTLCAAPPPGVECRTRGVSRDGNFALRPLPTDEARAQLRHLLALYRAGLQAPLRFFPKSAWEYACQNDENRARTEASKKWANGNFPEKNDAAYRLALRGLDDALDDAFRDNAKAVFGELRKYLEE